MTHHLCPKVSSILEKDLLCDVHDNELVLGVKLHPPSKLHKGTKVKV